MSQRHRWNPNNNNNTLAASEDLWSEISKYDGDITDNLISGHDPKEGGGKGMRELSSSRLMEMVYILSVCLFKLTELNT